MKKIYSLKGRTVFQEVFKRGKKYSGKDSRIIVRRWIRETEESGRPENRDGRSEKRIRIGIAVKKKYGNAVARNRVKRIVRSICRELLPLMHEGYYIIIQPESGLQDAGCFRIREELTELFKKAGIMK